MGGTMSIVLQGSTSGSITLQEPAVAGSTTINLPATSGTALVAPTALTVPNTTGTVMVSGNMPAFSAYQSSQQTISATTATKVQFQTEEFDTAGCFNNTNSTVTLNGISTPAYAFAPNVAGYYQFTFYYETNATQAYMYAYFAKNGSTIKRSSMGSNPGTGCIATALVYMNGTSDYMEAALFLATGTTLNNALNTVYFQAAMVRAA